MCTPPERQRPFVFTNLKDGTGLNEVVDWLKHNLKTSPEQRRSIIDAHAPYVGHAHSHDHEH